jgi:glycosyltransferase involved in cell wall biosynthesis
MSFGIATIMSPIGVNTTIIQDGFNGFLATNENEWVEKLSKLIKDENLRIQLGKRGQETVEKHYSFNAQKDIYIEIFESLLSKQN